jgi:hypothetical protein
MCRGRRARILLHLNIQLEKTVLRGSRAAQLVAILREGVPEIGGETRGLCLLLQYLL